MPSKPRQRGDCWAVKREVFNEFGEWPDCPYCEEPFHVTDGQVDHIHSASAGGGNSRSNTVLVCYTCNQRRSNSPLVRWLILMKRNPERVYWSLKARHKRIPTDMLDYLGFPE